MGMVIKAIGEATPIPVLRAAVLFFDASRSTAVRSIFWPLGEKSFQRDPRRLFGQPPVSMKQDCREHLNVSVLVWIAQVSMAHDSLIFLESCLDLPEHER